MALAVMWIVLNPRIGKCPLGRGEEPRAPASKNNPVVNALAKWVLGDALNHAFKNLPPEVSQLINITGPVGESVDTFLNGTSTSNKGGPNPGLEDLAKEITRELNSFKRSVKVQKDSEFVLIGVTMKLSAPALPGVKDEGVSYHLYVTGDADKKAAEKPSTHAAQNGRAVVQDTEGCAVCGRMEFLQANKDFRAAVKFVFVAYSNGVWQVKEKQLLFEAEKADSVWKMSKPAKYGEP